MILPQYFFDGALSLTWAVLKSSRWAAVDGAGEHRGQAAGVRIRAGEHRALLRVDQIAGVRRVSGHHLWCQHGGWYPASLLNGALHVVQEPLLYCMKRRWSIMENEWTNMDNLVYIIIIFSIYLFLNWHFKVWCNAGNHPNYALIVPIRTWHFNSIVYYLSFNNCNRISSV